MPALGEHVNVWNTALGVLRSKGYDVWRDTAADMFACQRDGWDFLADSPVALLGLVAIFEQRRPAGYREYWWRDRDAPDVRSLPTEAPGYTPIQQCDR